MPGYHASSHSGSDPESFFAARSAAQAVAAVDLSQGSWVLTTAVGLALHNATTLPGPANDTDFGPEPCGWTSPAGGTPGAITIPVTPAGTPSGETAAWVFEYLPTTSNGANTEMVIATVLNGQASVYGVMGGAGCSAPMSQNFTYGDLSSGVIDSTQAAGVADSWGGSAFLSNFTGANAVYVVTASVSVHLVEYVYPPCYGNYSNCNGTWTNGTPPPPYNYPGMPVIYDNYTTPSLWDVTYTTLPLGVSEAGPVMNGTMMPSTPWAVFGAVVSATNGTLISEDAYTSETGGCYGGCVFYPPAEPMGPGGVGTALPLMAPVMRGSITA
jgi:hypothetical protein